MASLAHFCAEEMDAPGALRGICNVCKVPTPKFCARCHTTFYCSAECQRADYKLHKRGCLSRGPQSSASGGTLAEFCQSDMKPRALQFRAGLAGTFDVQCSEQPVGGLPPDGAKVRVAWRVEAGPGLRAESGVTEDFIFSSGASVAADLYAVSTRALEEGKMLRGGWLYLAGEPEFFWSMFIHWRASGTVAPGAPAEGLRWREHSVWGRDLARQEANLAAAVAGAPAARASTLYTPSRSLAAAAALSRVPLPFISDVFIPMQGALPAWWRNAAAPWEAALQRAAARGGTPPCMWHLTPRVTDHVPPQGCPAHHDEEWAADVEALKQQGHAAH